MVPKVREGRALLGRTNWKCEAAACERVCVTGKSGSCSCLCSAVNRFDTTRVFFHFCTNLLPQNWKGFCVAVSLSFHTRRSLICSTVCLSLSLSPHAALFTHTVRLAFVRCRDYQVSGPLSITILSLSLSLFLIQTVLPPRRRCCAHANERRRKTLSHSIRGVRERVQRRLLQACKRDRKGGHRHTKADR